MKRLSIGCAMSLMLVSGAAMASHGTGTGQSFTFLEAGFSQEIFGVYPSFMGGVAFAPDGDPLVNFCYYGGSPLVRFDRQGIETEVFGTKLHPATSIPSNAGCGMTNHPDGTLYTNTSAGVVNLDAVTGVDLRAPFGPAGNALGITPDPQTGNIVYVGSDGTIVFVDSSFTMSGTFSTVTTGNFVDGIFFDPTGDHLFLANRSPAYRLTIVDRTGALVQHIAMPSEPDGIAFRATSPKFVVTSNTDGTMTRFDFPGDDFTQVPTMSAFATGGFRGDLSQVGPDGCLYLTQDGTRYDDGTISGENSLVRVCPGFSPPAGIEGPADDPNCSDGIDNDGDLLVDGDDPDCAGGGVGCAATPNPSCLSVAQAALQYDEKVAGKEKLKLQWKKIAAGTAQGDYGDPVGGSTSVALCLYDDSSSLVQGMLVDRGGQLCAGKACWKTLGTTGLGYKDKDSSADGVSKMSYKAGGPGRGKADARGKNNAVKGQTALPTGVVASLAGNSAVTIQMVTSDGFCVGATMTSVTIDDGTRYKAQKK